MTSEQKMIGRSALRLAFGMLILIVSTEAAPAPAAIASNGVFLSGRTALVAPGMRTSENGQFTCSFEISSACEATRTLANFALFENKAMAFSLQAVPGSDVQVSNAGYLLFFEPGPGGESEFTLHCYDKTGAKIFSRHYKNKGMSGFSSKGGLFGIGDNASLDVITLATGATVSCPCRKGYQFAFSDDETTVAIGCEYSLRCFAAGGKQIGSVATGMVYPRKTAISPDNTTVAIVDRTGLKVYSLPALTLIKHDALGGNYSFNDVRLDNRTVWAGVRYRDDAVTKGIIKTYGLNNGSATQEVRATETVDRSQMVLPLPKAAAAAKDYPQIPWPLAPQNQGHAVWNNYEMINTDVNGDTANGFPYMHQGIDMDCPANTRVYAVMDGVVKCKLTFASAPDIYWRIATNEVPDTGWSEGWLYAHLVPATIQFNVGDSVRRGDYIGQIVPWDNVGGHLHFARIRDHGAVWSFDDDEWGIVYNPELSLVPNPDKIAPKFVAARSAAPTVKFAYCRNETSTYLAPNSLSGDIDIIAKVFDTINGSQFTQPAYSIDYWIKRRDNNAMVADTTRGYTRNHAFPFYSTTFYHPYTLMEFKVDVANFPPGGWFTRHRTFAHIITNNLGADSIIALGWKDSCLHTNNFVRTWHRLFVKACDAAGNCTVDSEDVYFAGGIVTGVEEQKQGVQLTRGMTISSNIEGTAMIHYSLPDAGNIKLSVFDLSGNRITTLAQGYHAKGAFNAAWDGNKSSGKRSGSGMYVFVLRTVSGNSIQKQMVYR